MMDIVKCKKLRLDRLNYVQSAAVNPDCSLKNDRKGLYLKAGDLVHTSGLTMREIKMAKLPAKGKNELIQALIDYCFPFWDILELELEKEREEAAAKREADARQQRWRKFGPPLRYAEMESSAFEIENEQDQKAFDSVIEFSCGSRTNLAILGPPGTRKTQLAALFLREEMLNYGEQGQFISASELVRDAKSVELIKNYITVKYLVIDDVASNANDVEILMRVVDARLNKRLSTVYTSNATPTQLKEIYGARGFSRLMCKAEIVVVSGRDWRL